MLTISALYLKKQKSFVPKKICCMLVIETLKYIVIRASARDYTIFSMVLKVAFIQKGLMLFTFPQTVEPNYFTELKF